MYRELHEELGIQVVTAYPWLTQIYAYSHATVRLHFYRVTRWKGKLRALEHEAISWQHPQTPSVNPMLPANAPILRSLQLSSIYAITDTQSFGASATLNRLEKEFSQALRLVQIREKKIPEKKVISFSKKVLKLAHDAIVMINSDHSFRLSDIDGIHLTSEHLMRISKRPAYSWCAASCHNKAQLQQASDLNLDFVVLGPVKPTSSHPHSAALGWKKFAKLIKNYPLPVYALGGLAKKDLKIAWEHGAHGIAMISGVWGTVKK